MLLFAAFLIDNSLMLFPHIAAKLRTSLTICETFLTGLTRRRQAASASTTSSFGLGRNTMITASFGVLVTPRTPLIPAA
jgi:hypothetical protein